MPSQYFPITCFIIYCGVTFQLAMPWASVVLALSYQRGNLAANCLPICRGSERERSKLSGILFPFSFVSAARRGNRDWPMSYWVNIRPQSWRPPDHRAWRLNTPWVPAGSVAVGISVGSAGLYSCLLSPPSTYAKHLPLCSEAVLKYLVNFQPPRRGFS